MLVEQNQTYDPDQSTMQVTESDVIQTELKQELTMSEHGKEHMFETFEQRPGRSPKPLKVQKVVKQVSALP